MKDTSHRIALLATGDEIIQGDILNTNSQHISQTFADHDLLVETHYAVRDNKDHIEKAIRFLLQSHDCLITTGGLGPTSDDLTRYALSSAVSRELIFDENTWESISKRIQSLGYKKTPESNRQQALFPEGATIIPNQNGTAAGCMIQLNQQWIFMLPGPPIECLTMIEQAVLPTLIKAGFQKKCFREKWLLFGVSEGQIAEELDALVKPYECVTGYRLAYPYVEFKLFSSSENDFKQVLPSVNAVVQPYLVGDGKRSGSAQFKLALQNRKSPLNILDLATGGFLESQLKTPNTASQLHFSSNDFDVRLSGLDDYWKQNTVTHTHLKLEFRDGKINEATIPLRGDRVKLYAVEWFCREVMKVLV